VASISNLFIDASSNFSTTVTVTDTAGVALDLTGYTALAQIRKSYSSSLIETITSSFAVDRTTGNITLSLTDTQTKTLEVGRYLYDLVITDTGSTKTRVIEGQVIVNPGVTRT
jgi:hypothetical protein